MTSSWGSWMVSWLVDTPSTPQPPTPTPPAPPTSDSYIKIYILYAILFIIFYAFSSPFTGNRESRLAWDPYVYGSVFLYAWLSSTVFFHLPLLSYDTKVPISIFFPLFLATFSVLFMFEAVLKVAHSTFVFHVGFKGTTMDILQTSVMISALCCLLYAHCEDDMSRIENQVCYYLYSMPVHSILPFDVPPMFTLWSTLVMLMMFNKAMERLTNVRAILAPVNMRGYAGFFFPTPVTTATATATAPSSASASASTHSHHHNHHDDHDGGGDGGGDHDDDVNNGGGDGGGDHDDDVNNDGGNDGDDDDGDEVVQLPMVPWYALVTAYALVDLLVYLKVFVGRFDVRKMTDQSQCVHDHLAENDELWFDWVADTGDGFNSTYTIANLLAQPSLSVSHSSSASSSLVLPRGRLLVVGGDLAYPTPSEHTYRQRLFVPFSQALATPPHVKHPSRFSVAKPDLPPDCHRLADYDGPQCFAIPGNHDYFDGLQTFMRHIVHRDWLGGWLLPQRTAYFALRLPHNWWLFGLDMALSEDIDEVQGAFFARLAAALPSARIIIATHDPDWILTAYEHDHHYDMASSPSSSSSSPPPSRAGNLAYLLQQLGDKVKLRLAGDIHNYSRHMGVFVPPPGHDYPFDEDVRVATAPADTSGVAGAGMGAGAGDDPSLSSASSLSLSASKIRRSQSFSFPTPPAPAPSSSSAAAVAVEAAAAATARTSGDMFSSLTDADAAAGGDGWRARDDRIELDHALSSRRRHMVLEWSVQDVHDWLTDSLSLPHEAIMFKRHGVDGKLLVELSASDIRGELRVTSELCVKKLLIEIRLLRQQAVEVQPLVPASLEDDGIYVSLDACASPIADDSTRGDGGSGGGRSTTTTTAPPSSSPSRARGGRNTNSASWSHRPVLIVSGGGGAFMHPTHVPSGRPITVPCGDERTPYVRVCAYPSETTSRRYALRNLFHFRHLNFRFDVFGAVTYFGLVWSMLPLCKLDHITTSATWMEMVVQVAYTVFVLHVEMFDNSVISMMSFIMLLISTIGFVESAGVSTWKRVLIGLALTIIHSCAAFTIFVVLEVALETAGNTGMMDSSESVAAIFSRNFPSVTWVIRALDSLLPSSGNVDVVGAVFVHADTTPPVIGGLLEQVLLFSINIFDLPSSIFRLKSVFCAHKSASTATTTAAAAARHAFTTATTTASSVVGGGGGIESLSRLRTVAYYLGCFLYFWVMVTPVVSFIFGVYLYVSVNHFESHWNESFSSLRVQDHKNFLRMHITKTGDLEVYALGVDKVPRKWRRDGRWSGRQERHLPSYRWSVPSRYTPEERQIEPRIIDFVRIRATRPPHN